MVRKYAYTDTTEPSRSVHILKGLEMTITKTDIIAKNYALLHVENQYIQLKAQADEMNQEYELQLEQAFKPSDEFTKNDVEISGTHRQGEIVTTREQLIKTFGAPSYCDWDSGDKITIEWEMRFNDGTIATIYDYKRIECGEEAEPIDLFEEFEWNIGGNCSEAVQKVTDLLNGALQ